MKKTLLKAWTLFVFLLVGVSGHAAEGDPKGRLICWDHRNPEAVIPGYLGPLNESDLDSHGRRSFVMDFTEDTKYWGWSLDKSKKIISYEWSISECEDMNAFHFSKVALDRVLKGDQKSTLVRYVAEGPDETTRVGLRCVRLLTKDQGRPVFKF